MLKINIIAVGKIKEKYIEDGIYEFKKRLSKYVNLKIIEINEFACSDVSIKKESDLIIEKINKKAFNILLDINSKQLSSEEFAELIDKTSLTKSEINFIIGGSMGVSKEVKDNVDMKISFSKFTFPHQLFRLIVLEQIYRAISIINNIKYHK